MARLQKVKMILSENLVPEKAEFGTVFVCKDIAAGFKNWQGGREWKWMFSHPGQKLPQMGSAWAQFMVFWG